MKVFHRANLLILFFLLINPFRFQFFMHIFLFVDDFYLYFYWLFSTSIQTEYSDMGVCSMCVDLGKWISRFNKHFGWVLAPQATCTVYIKCRIEPIPMQMYNYIFHCYFSSTIYFIPFLLLIANPSVLLPISAALRFHSTLKRKKMNMAYGNVHNSENW